MQYYGVVQCVTYVNMWIRRMCDRAAPFLSLKNDPEGRIFSFIYQMLILYFDLISFETVI